MDSRAKQRVTGAVILAALFVLLVPELLTGPKSPVAPAAPAEDEQGLRSYTIDIDGNSTAATPSAPQPAPAASAAPAEAGEAAPAETEAAPTARPEPRSAAQEAPRREVTPTPQAAPAQTPTTSAATARPASPQPTPTQAATPPARGSFVVQLGSFGSRDNADRLVRDMSAKGFKAFVAPIRSGGRDLYRVRVGPTPDRASAEALAADLKRAGQSGSIVPIS
jgi:DedD protein